MTILSISRAAHTQTEIDRNGLDKAIFTDGSFKLREFGGYGLYAPGYTSERLQSYGSHTTDLSRCRPLTFELLGILRAVQTSSALKEAFVYTDSLESLKLINIRWRVRDSLTSHPDLWIIKKIVDVAEKSPVRFHFCKVKGHTGIEGNELADALAKIGSSLNLNERRTFSQNMGHKKNWLKRKLVKCT